MGLTAELCQQAGISVKRIGGLELIAASDAEGFIRAARARGVVILGIEGFRIQGSGVSPDMDAIADFSTLADDNEGAAKSLQAADRFLSGASRQDLYFDFTVKEGRAA